MVLVVLSVLVVIPVCVETSRLQWCWLVLKTCLHSWQLSAGWGEWWLWSGCRRTTSPWPCSGVHPRCIRPPQGVRDQRETLKVTSYFLNWLLFAIIRYNISKKIMFLSFFMSFFFQFRYVGCVRFLQSIGNWTSYHKSVLMEFLNVWNWLFWSSNLVSSLNFSGGLLSHSNVKPMQDSWNKFCLKKVIYLRET